MEGRRRVYHGETVYGEENERKEDGKIKEKEIRDCGGDSGRKKADEKMQSR